MVLEYKFCIKKWKFLIGTCFNTYYKKTEIQADKGNLFSFSMSICATNEFQFALNEIQLAPYKTQFAPNKTQFVPNKTHVPNETQFAPNETHVPNETIYYK